MYFHLEFGWAKLVRCQRSRSGSIAICCVVLCGCLLLTETVQAQSASVETVAQTNSGKRTGVEDLRVDEPSRTQAREFVDRLTRAARLRADIDFLRDEQRRLQRLQGEGRVSVFDETGVLSSDAAEILNRALADNSRSVLALAETVAANSDRPFDEARETWIAQRAALLSGRKAAFEANARSDLVGQLANVLNVDNRWLWLCGSLALATMTGLYLVDRRHQLRRLFHVRKTRSIGLGLVVGLFLMLVLTPTIVTVFFGNYAYDRLLALQDAENAPHAVFERELAALPSLAELDELATERDAVQTEVSTTWEKLKSRWNLSPALQPFLQEREEARANLRQATVQLATRRAIASGRAADRDKLAAVRQELQGKQSAIQQSQRQKRLTAGILGATLLALTGGLGAWFLRSRKQRLDRQAKTCPQCLAVGTLKLAVDGARLGVPELRCENVIRQQPRYEECEFTFPESYRSYPKLGFPTLGVATSGKTHWMAMIYRELNNGRYPGQVSFQRVKSRGSMEFDRLVERILDTRMKLPGTTANRLPDPVVFSFRDSDRWGRSTVLTSLFDYAGQITTDVGHHHRRRALDGDGFLFFLDPTKPAERQAQALADFAEDLRLVKKLKPGQQLHTPVALCVTRLDLMICNEQVKDTDGKRVNLNNTLCRNTENTREYYHELGRIDRRYHEMSLGLLQQRSGLTAQLRGDIWGEWNIEQQIRNLFGSRYLFFPMTPVGLNDLPLTGPATAADLAHIVDLNRRIIQPYAILEPLLWLLQMNGYPVLR